MIVSEHERAATRLDAELAGVGPSAVIAEAARRHRGKIAVVSSFGADSAVLLSFVAEIEPTLPVIFLDTGLHFPQTLQYRARLQSYLDLRDVRIVVPDESERANADPADELWMRDVDACCDLRKVRPLARALAPFEAWISGRKRFQSATRAALPVVEWDGTHIKYNPLAALSADALGSLASARNLPEHPLRPLGYASIGCRPCTQPVSDGEAARGGRWRDLDKTECGIHRSPVRSVS